MQKGRHLAANYFEISQVLAPGPRKIPDMLNKVVIAIFTISCAMALLLVAIILADPVASSGGVPHPVIPGMMIGGDGAARMLEIGVLAFLFQSLLLLLIVALAALGVSAKHHSIKLYLLLALTWLFTMFIWWQMYFGHLDYLETGETGYFLGFPIATAWQVYGTWLGAIPLILIYVFGFKNFIHSDEDERKYQQLLQDNNAE